MIYNKLRELQRNLGGPEQLPLIPQTYFSSWKAMNFSTGFPMVGKLGTVHAGFGKVSSFHSFLDKNL